MGVVGSGRGESGGWRRGGDATATINGCPGVAPVLPDRALLSDKDGAFVYIIDAQNKARRRAVTTGLATVQGLAVVKGLDGSERVVLRAGGFLNPGESVNPKLQKSSGE